MKFAIFCYTYEIVLQQLRVRVNAATKTNVTLRQWNAIISAISIRSLVVNGERILPACGNITDACDDETDQQNMQQDLRALISS